MSEVKCHAVVGRRRSAWEGHGVPLYFGNWQWATGGKVLDRMIHTNLRTRLLYPNQRHGLGRLGRDMCKRRLLQVAVKEGRARLRFAGIFGTRVKGNNDVHLLC